MHLKVIDNALPILRQLVFSQRCDSPLSDDGGIVDAAGTISLAQPGEMN